jgi:hypothetical protein
LLEGVAGLALFWPGWDPRHRARDGREERFSAYGSLPADKSARLSRWGTLPNAACPAFEALEWSA